MKTIKTLVLIATVFSAAGCIQKIDTPESETGKEVRFRFEVQQPTSPDTKVTLEDGGALSWTGDETATLIFGIDGKNNSNNPTLTSTAPGVFEGTVTIPDGFTIENLRGLVVPGDNGANFRGDHSSAKARIRMYTAESQTQATNGVVNPKYVPFFTEISADDLTLTDGTYSFSGGGKKLWSGSDLIRFNIYGSHADQESDEVFKSIAIEASGTISNSSEYNCGSGATTYNSNSSKKAGVSLTEALTFADRTAENGIEVYLGVILGGKRTVSKVTVTTDKAVYTKTASISLSQDHVEKLNVYQANINLANGFTRSSQIKYSSDGGSTWSESIPETFSSLSVQTANGVNLTELSMTRIKDAIAAQGVPVELDLSKASYASTIFPAIFNGTADAKSTLLKSVNFPKNVTEVAENAFAYCSSLESVDLTGIKTINTKAFFFTGLKTLDVPRTVTSIPGYLVFGCCAQLNEIYYDSPATHGDVASGYNHATFAFADVTSGTANTDNYAMNKDTYPEFYPAEPQCVVTIGPNVAYIARRMFIHNDNIAEIIFQTKPAKIGNYAFNYLKNVHTFDCRMMSSPISSYSNDTYQKQLGQSAKAAGKTLRILVAAGMTDSFSEKYPFKWMIKNGWSIIEDTSEPATLENVRIGTYNVRIQSSGDGDNNWPTRQTVCLQSIKDIDFDIFGLQEAQTYHQQYLASTLTDIYHFEWFCPNKGSSKESIGIAYKKENWSLAAKNTFWINPDDPTVQKAYDYSSSYKSYFYRGAICGMFIHKKTGTKLFFMCTHGCLGQTQNEESAFLYPQQEALYNPDGVPSFFVGDFNARPDWASSTLYRTYWNDTYLTINESLRQGCENTFNGFDSPEGRDNRRIDFVYYKGDGVTPTLYKCDNTLIDGKYPSDHWPVFADFTIGAINEQ